MHHLYVFELLFPVIQLHAEKKSGFFSAKNNIFENLNVRRDVAPKRELDRKLPEKTASRGGLPYIHRYMYCIWSLIQYIVYQLFPSN